MAGFLLGEELVDLFFSRVKRSGRPISPATQENSRRIQISDIESGRILEHFIFARLFLCGLSFVWPISTILALVLHTS
jgi:hypothetical protein